MPVAHRTNSAAAKNSRLRTVVRQLSEVGSLNWFLPGPRDHRRRRRLGWNDPFDDDGSARLGRHQVQLLRREKFNALGRPQRFNLEPQVTIDFLLLAALLLHLLDPIAVLQELDALPP